MNHCWRLRPPVLMYGGLLCLSFCLSVCYLTKIDWTIIHIMIRIVAWTLKFGMGMHLDAIWVDPKGQGHRSNGRVRKKQIILLSGTTKNCGGQVDSKATCPRDKCHKTTSNDPISCLLYILVDKCENVRTSRSLGYLSNGQVEILSPGQMSRSGQNVFTWPKLTGQYFISRIRGHHYILKVKENSRWAHFNITSHFFTFRVPWCSKHCSMAVVFLSSNTKTDIT